jgi:hypothetical protein
MTCSYIPAEAEESDSLDETSRRGGMLAYSSSEFSNSELLRSAQLMSVGRGAVNNWPTLFVNSEFIENGLLSVVSWFGHGLARETRLVWMRFM